MSTISNSYETTYEARKVTSNADGSSTSVVQGDTSAFKTDDSMGKDQFLQLLIAQLQHQDPLNPADDTQFVTQLAQFSQLEYTQNSTEAISELASYMYDFMELQTLQAQSITNSSATPLLGKEVRVMEATFKHEGLTEREFNIHLLEGYKQGTVVIKDSDGNIVAELDVFLDNANTKGEDITIKWDGKDLDDKQLLGGTYSVEVLDVTGSKSVGYAYQEGTVSGVSFSSSGASLTINEIKYGLGYLVSVEE